MSEKYGSHTIYASPREEVDCRREQEPIAAIWKSIRRSHMDNMLFEFNFVAAALHLSTPQSQAR
jgi:hypothetical protein